MDDCIMKLISVIVPAYNVDKYISRCLDSILGQRYTNLEILVVDDGSTDNTPSIVDEYASRDSRIKVIHQDNTGLSGARNSALKIVTGDYIGYVDGDDYIEPSMYEEMINACESTGAEIAVTEYKEVGGNDNRKYSGDTYVLPRDEALNTFICDDKSYRIYHSVWSKLYRKDIVDGLLFPVGHNSEDIMYTTKAMCASSLCVMIDKPLYNYIFDRPDSIMNTKLEDRRFNDELPFTREKVQYFEKLGLVDLHTKAVYYYYHRLLLYYSDFRNRKMKHAAKKIASEIKENESTIREVYASYFAKKGDQSRMKLFLISPSSYYYIQLLYNHSIVPIKSKVKAYFQ